MKKSSSESSKSWETGKSPNIQKSKYSPGPSDMHSAHQESKDIENIPEEPQKEDDSELYHSIQEEEEYSKSNLKKEDSVGPSEDTEQMKEAQQKEVHQRFAHLNSTPLQNQIDEENVEMRKNFRGKLKIDLLYETCLKLFEFQWKSVLSEESKRIDSDLSKMQEQKESAESLLGSDDTYMS